MLPENVYLVFSAKYIILILDISIIKLQILMTFGFAVL